jgi:Domain of unknown function (DUF4153)
MSALGTRLGGLASDIGAGVRRFPLPLAAGLGGAIAGVCLFACEGRFRKDEPLHAVALTCWLGVALFLAAALAGERHGPEAAGGATRPRRAATLAWSVLVAAALAGCYASLRHQSHDNDWYFIRFVLWLIAAHALLALAPLAGRRPRGDFRAFNLMLFSRTALALLLTGVLQAGLSLGIAAVDHLFDVHVPSQIFGELWFVLMGVFNTAYVLAGIPRDWDKLEGRFPTPRALDVLARQVLLPLSVLYLVILYVYSVKIIVVHEWPRGWVSVPVIAFAAVGLLTVLLLEPGREKGTRFVRAYCRGFFFALLPLVVLLFLAISRRALEYGLTEERCLVYAITAFLAVIGPYFVLSRARNLAVIPLVLAVIALLTSVGPLSARSVSVRSQTARVRTLLVKHHRLEHGVLVRGTSPIDKKDEHEISAALSYLDSRDELGRVLAWRAPHPESCPACVNVSDGVSDTRLVQALGMDYRPGRYDSVDTLSRYAAIVPPLLDTAGFNWVMPVLHFWSRDQARELSTGALPPGWRIRLEDDALVVGHEHKDLGRISFAELEARTKKALGDAKDGGLLPLELLTEEGSWGPNRYRLLLSEITFDHDEDGTHPRVSSIAGVLLLSVAPGP